MNVVDLRRLRLRALRADNLVQELLVVLTDYAKDIPGPVLDVASAVAQRHAHPGRVTESELASLKFCQLEEAYERSSGDAREHVEAGTRAPLQLREPSECG